MPRRPLSAAARSPALPWSHTAQQQAANGVHALGPAEPAASPVQHVAAAALGHAVSCRWCSPPDGRPARPPPCRGPSAPDTTPRTGAAKAAAAATPSAADRSPPARKNSPSWGVITVTRPRRRDNSSICRASAFMPSASSTSGWASVQQAAHQRIRSAAPRPRPQPSSYRRRSPPHAAG